MEKMKALILTFDEEKEIHSKKPKVMHEVLGKSILGHVVDEMKKLSADELIILGEDIYEEIEGTIPVKDGDKGIAACIPYIESDDTVLIVDASMPLVTKEVLQGLLDTHYMADSFMTVANNYKGFGGTFYCFRGSALHEVVRHVSVNCPEGCYNMHSFCLSAKGLGYVPKEYLSDSRYAFLYINNRVDLAHAIKVFREKINTRHMLNGVTIIDPSGTFIGPDVEIDGDVTIHHGCVIEGKIRIGCGSVIGPNTIIKNSSIGNETSVISGVILNSSVGDFCEIGPFAYIRPGCNIGDHVKVGDFVEIKNSDIGNHTKASHLTYIGDSDVGENINFGCGTVTVNYDGANKHRTVIEDNAFIGCNTNLVAPVVVGEGAFVAAGSTITEDVPRANLSVARARQVNKDNWKRP